jgi:hypothetical protein
MQDDQKDLANDAALASLKTETVALLSAASDHSANLRLAIEYYLRTGYSLGLCASELIAFFCVDTPTILEEAGFEGAAGDSVAALFDEVHDRFRKQTRR